MSKPDQCSVRRDLTRKLGEAVRSCFAAKSEWEAAEKCKDTSAAELATKLATARAEERRAINALQQHKDEHGCGR